MKTSTQISTENQYPSVLKIIQCCAVVITMIVLYIVQIKSVGIFLCWKYSTNIQKTKPNVKIDIELAKYDTKQVTTDIEHENSKKSQNQNNNTTEKLSKNTLFNNGGQKHNSKRIINNNNVTIDPTISHINILFHLSAIFHITHICMTISEVTIPIHIFLFFLCFCGIYYITRKPTNKQTNKQTKTKVCSQFRDFKISLSRTKYC